MDQKSLSADLRKEMRKGAARRLRKTGRIPAIMYGHAGVAPVSVDGREFGAKFKRITENTIISLTFDGASHDVLVKDFQEDVLTGDITHIDFYEIESDKALRTNVPLHLLGNPVGVREGGLLEQRLHEIEVECLPKDIPSQFEVDVAAMQIGDTIHVADIPPVEGVRVLNTPDQVVVAVSHAKEELIAAVAAEEEGAAASEAAEGEAAETDEQAED